MNNSQIIRQILAILLFGMWAEPFFTQTFGKVALGVVVRVGVIFSPKMVLKNREFIVNSLVNYFIDSKTFFGIRVGLVIRGNI